MASESTDSADVSVSIPADLVEWLESHAADRDVDPGAVLAQLVETYRQTADGETLDPAESTVDREEIEGLLEEVVAERREEIAAAVAADVADEVDVLGDRLDELEADYREALADVRQRVVQVKRETDAKAPADHDHDAFDRLDELASRLDDLAADVAALEAEVETRAAEATLDDLAATVDEQAATLIDSESRLDDVEEKLRTVGWAVSDLREERRDRGTDTLDRIKAAAAGHDLSRAVCENCGEGVEIALMTRPACPHCDAAVTNVEPASGFFGKPALVTASQIEGGTDETSTDDVSMTGSDRR